jgi:hypothetical protein
MQTARCRHHGDRIVASVLDCAVSPRRQDAGVVLVRRRRSLSLDDLDTILSRPPRTLAELADKIRAFWSRQ